MIIVVTTTVQAGHITGLAHRAAIIDTVPTVNMPVKHDLHHHGTPIKVTAALKEGCRA